MGQTLCFRCMRRLEQEDELHYLTKTCDKCFTAVLSAQEEKLSAYLEALDIPAALVSQDHTVLSSNSRFQKMAPRGNGVGLSLGEVIECMYSPLLGRCGETVACLLCRLRRSIERTLTTREGLRGIPISFPHKAEGRKTLTITTEMVGNAVLLLLGTPDSKGSR